MHTTTKTSDVDRPKAVIVSTDFLSGSDKQYSVVYQPEAVLTPADIKFDDIDFLDYGIALGSEGVYVNPSSLKQAKTLVDAPQWISSDGGEVQQLLDKGVIEMGDLPTDRDVEVLNTKDVLKRKEDENDDLDKYKSRICARGDLQCKVRNSP